MSRTAPTTDPPPANILRGMSSPRLLALLLPLTACPTGADETTLTSSTGPDTTGAPDTTGTPLTTSDTTDTPTTAPATSEPTTDPTTATTGTTDAATTTATTTATSDTTDDTTTDAPPAMPTVLLPRASITNTELAVLVNDQDPQSMAVAAYYQQARQIPAQNVITLSFPPAETLATDAFNSLKAQIDAAAGPQIQAFAVAWTNPHKVDCQSLVSALALGTDMKYCQPQPPCNPTAPGGFFDSPSLAPFTDLGIRPAMHLAGVNADDVYKLIDRGVAADSTYPSATGYLLRTTDSARSVRFYQFEAAKAAWAYDGGLTLEYLDNSGGMGLDYIEGKTDVLFYLTGLADVPQIASNMYLPGAIADHLTSYGGHIPDNGGQMSIVRWLEAGATASYGTAFEPCNYTNKFPDAGVLLPHYFRGETLIEAYWKSVDWPGEGVFVGEPLARPWGGAIVSWEPPMLTIETYQLIPGKLYTLESAPSADGPWTLVQDDITTLQNKRTAITIADASEPFYRLTMKS